VECDADHMRICQFFGLDLESGDSTIKLLCDSIADAADIPKPMEGLYICLAHYALAHLTPGF